jgi:rod shape-determining protein MreC
MGRDTRRARFLLGGLLIIALVLITLDVSAGKSGGGVRKVADSIASPIERAAAAAIRPVRNAFGGNDDSQRKRADTLAKENAALQRRIATDAEAQRLSASLTRLKLQASAASYKMIPARVIATGDTTGTERTVDLGIGSSSGLAVGQLVVNTDGLVGTVVRVTSNVATVRLVDDPRTVIGARLTTSTALATVSGDDNANQLLVTLYDPSLAVRPGERVVTYGSADYAGGIPIGITVAEGDIGAAPSAGSLTQAVKVRPFVHFGTLDLVAVIVGSTK